jgi:hypothetical protein
MTNEKLQETYMLFNKTYKYKNEEEHNKSISNILLASSTLIALLLSFNNKDIKSLSTDKTRIPNV